MEYAILWGGVSPTIAEVPNGTTGGYPGEIVYGADGQQTITRTGTGRTYQVRHLTVMVDGVEMTCPVLMGIQLGADGRPIPTPSDMSMVMGVIPQALETAAMGGSAAVRAAVGEARTLASQTMWLPSTA